MDDMIDLGSFKKETKAATVNYTMPDGLPDGHGGSYRKPDRD